MVSALLIESPGLELLSAVTAQVPLPVFLAEGVEGELSLGSLSL